MAVTINGRQIGGVGTGGGFSLGPETNAFISTAARDTYATANADWLESYDDNPAFIVQVTVGTTVTYYRRNNDAWEDVANIIGLVASAAAIQTAVTTAVNAAVADFLTSTEIATEISDAVSDFDTRTQIASDIATAIADFLTSTEIATAISTAVADFDTRTQIATDIATAIADFLTSTEIATAISTAVADFDTRTQIASDIATAVADFLTSTEITALIPEVDDVTIELNADGRLQVKEITDTQISASLTTDEQESFRNKIGVTPGGGTSSPTNLSVINRDEDSLDIASSTGTDALLPAATATEAGLATAAQITKLDGIEDEATKNSAGSGLEESSEGELSVDDDYVTNLVPGGGGGGSPTNLSVDNRDADSLDIASSTGTDATIPGATATEAGLATAAQITKLDGIEDEATKNSAGSGLDESTEGELSVDDGYVDNLIEAADHWRESFRLGFVTSFFTTTQSRWGADATTIYMQPTVSHRGIVEELLSGAQMQVREPSGSVRNKFTLTSDVGDPDSNHVYTLNGTWDNSPVFVNGTNYTLLFSQSRPHVVRTDDTFTGDGNETPLGLADEAVDDQKVSASLTNEQQAEFQDRIGIERLGGHAPVTVIPANTTHTDDDIVLNPTIALLSYIEGLGYRFRTKRENDGAVTVAISSLGSRQLRKVDGTQFAAGELPLGYYVDIVYDAVTNRFVTFNIGTVSGDDDGTFVGLSDTPDSITADRYLKTNAAGDAISEVEAAPLENDIFVLHQGFPNAKANAAFINYSLSRAPVAGTVLEVAIFFGGTQPGSDPDDLPEERFNSVLPILIETNDWLSRPTNTSNNSTLGALSFEISRGDTTIDGFSNSTLYVARASDTSIRLASAHFNSFGSSVVRISELTHLTPIEDGTETNLSVGTRTATTVEIRSSSGENATLPASTTTQGGLQSGPDKVAQAEISEANITDGDSAVRGTPTGRRIRAAVEAFAPEAADTFHLTRDRNYVTGNANTSDDITITLLSGDTYNVGISHHVGAEALPDNYLRALPPGTEIRIVDDEIIWNGRLVSVHDVQGTSATLRINFTDRTGLLTDFEVNDTVQISFGYSPARIPRADEIDVDGTLDGNLSDSDPDLEAIVQEIDNFDLGGDEIAAGTGIGVTDDDPRVISNTLPFSDAESDILGELANTARHTAEDDLVLRLQYGGEHLFDGRDAIITGLASIDGHIYVGSEDGFVNEERAINEVGFYDITTNNNHSDTAGNWYFAETNIIRIRERNTSGIWSNASPSEYNTGISSTAGIGISADPDNLTVMYFMHEQGDGIRIQSLGIAIHPSSGVITTEAQHDITRASINSILTANDLQNISEIRNTNGNVGVTAMGVRDGVVYFVVTGIEDDEHGIASTVILRATTSGSGSTRTFTLDTEYVRKIGIRNNVQGLVPTESGFWISTQHVVYEYHESNYILPEPGENSDGDIVAYEQSTDTYILLDTTGLPATVDVDDDFFEGDGALATPITLKTDIAAASRDTFRNRIDAHQNVPIAVYYLRDQTERNPTTLREFPQAIGTASDRDILLSFTDTADETVYGGDIAIVPNLTWTNLNSTAFADWTGTAEDRSALMLPEGTWSFILNISGGSLSDADTELQVVRAVPAIDDIIVAHKPGFSRIIYTTYSINEEVVSITGNAPFYFIITRVTSDTDTSAARSASGYLMLKRHL